MQKFIIHITKPETDLLEDNTLECFLLAPDLDSAFIRNFVSLAHQKEKLVLSTDSKTVLEHNLDGIIIDLSKSENIASDYQEMTKGLKNKFIGAISRNRRHEAMLVGECEPDFVIFKAWSDGQEKVQELTSWFAEMFLLQSALLPVEDLDFSGFETDFVVLDDVQYKKIN